MSNYIDLREPPPNRRHCDGGQEKHLTEAAVMIAFAMYLLDRGALIVELHPDGEHGNEALAEQHPLVSEELVTIAGNVRNSATVLAVLVATREPSRFEYSRKSAQSH